MVSGMKRYFSTVRVEEMENPAAFRVLNGNEERSARVSYNSWIIVVHHTMQEALKAIAGMLFPVRAPYLPVIFHKSHRATSSCQDMTVKGKEPETERKNGYHDRQPQPIRNNR
jgi:hypothetical protein